MNNDCHGASTKFPTKSSDFEIFKTPPKLLQQTSSFRISAKPSISHNCTQPLFDSGRTERRESRGRRVRVRSGQKVRVRGTEVRQLRQKKTLTPPVAVSVVLAWQAAWPVYV
ncbi:Hypothetical protein NTJ_13279 [Nesidiocoris tenuis]|uniref:Uncharacterized protein n=1 Tax=Nesidiocoris tenuis TaxID=355587 RepID=A0ABN7BCC2_9HEMI|nr:Hypothetical protein NTJ_13279 [Nesidiocoris tenuis]